MTFLSHISFSYSGHVSVLDRVSDLRSRRGSTLSAALEKVTKRVNRRKKKQKKEQQEPTPIDFMHPFEDNAKVVMPTQRPSSKNGWTNGV